MPPSFCSSRRYPRRSAAKPGRFNGKREKRQGGVIHLAWLRPSDILFWRHRRSSDGAAYCWSFFSRSVSASFCRLRRNSISSSPEWKRRDFPESTSSIRPSSSFWLCSPWLPRRTTKAPCMTNFSLRQDQKYSVKKPWSSREICETQLNRASSSRLYNHKSVRKGFK